MPDDKKPHDLGDGYLNALEASEAEPARVTRSSARPCPVCAEPMEGGACPSHGTPAEDRGEWLMRGVR